MIYEYYKIVLSSWLTFINLITLREPWSWLAFVYSAEQLKNSYKTHFFWEKL